MTDSTDRAISAAESLKFLIEKTKRYDHLWEVAAEIILLILVISAILLVALLLILNYDFDNLVTNLGTFRLSTGNYLDMFNILGLAAGIALYVFVYRTSKVVKKKNEINNAVTFEHGDIKGLVKFIVSQDWDSLFQCIATFLYFLRWFFLSLLGKFSFPTYSIIQLTNFS